MGKRKSDKGNTVTVHYTVDLAEVESMGFYGVPVANPLNFL